MYYIYIISSTIIGLLLIAITYIVPILILREFDKITYIKGYKENLKWYKKPIYYLREILTYLVLTFSLILILIFVVVNPFKKKQFKEVFRVMFVTPLVGIGVTIFLAFGIHELLYYLEFYLIRGTFEVMYIIELFIIIPCYIILIVKQLINIIKVENKQLKEDYSEFKVEGEKKEEWVKAILSSSRKKEYIRSYLQINNTEKEWEESKFVLINYLNIHKAIFLIIIISIIMNFIISFIKYDIFKNNIEAFTVDIGSSMFVPYIIWVLEVLMFGVLITLLTNWMFNSRILISIKELKNSRKLVLKTFLVSIIPIILTIVAAISFVYNYSQYSDNLKPYEEQKEKLVDVMSRKKNYLEYNTYDKKQYIFGYPQYFMDDISELGYTYNSNEYEINGDIVNFCVPIQNNKIKDFFGYSDIKLSVDMGSISIDYLDCYEYIRESVVTIENNEEFYIYDSEQKQEEYEKNNPYGDYNSLANNKIEKIMKEEAIEAIDKVWEEEMKDRGLE
ncbi:MAG: hypothetical protein ACK5HR_03890 [Mycoplasmatales bacterium]